MDNSPASTPGPRRSQRDKKAVKHFASGILKSTPEIPNSIETVRLGASASTKRKRKQAETDVDDDAPNTAVEVARAEHEVESESESEEHEEGYRGPKQGRKRAKAGGSKTKGAPPAKRPKTAETEADDHTSGGEEADASAEEDDQGVKAPKGGKKGKGSPKVKTTRPRKPKGTANTKQGKPSGRRGRRVKEKGEGYDAEQIAKETKIATDNILFSAPHKFPPRAQFSLYSM
jgi:cohesin complex subunit SA-1/2